MFGAKTANKAAAAEAKAKKLREQELADKRERQQASGFANSAHRSSTQFTPGYTEEDATQILTQRGLLNTKLG